MTEKRLTVENAIIKTAAVEIKTLSISGKQVTLAVFRQVPTLSLLEHESLQLNGVPWGIVNYHPDKCAGDSDHIHVIWQKDKTLYRDTIYKRSHQQNPWDAEIGAHLRVYALRRLWMYYRCDECNGFMSNKWSKDTGSIFISEADGFICENGHTMPGDYWNGIPGSFLQWQSFYGEFSSVWKIDGYQWKIHINTNRTDELYQKAGAAQIEYESIDIHTMLQRIGNLVGQYREWYSLYRNQYDLLSALDQLYIAI